MSQFLPLDEGVRRKSAGRSDFIYAGYRLWFKKQIKLIGSSIRLKRKQEIDIVCRLSGIYTVISGLTILAIPIVHIFNSIMDILIMVLVSMVLSSVFWLFLSKKFFLPIQQTE